MHVNVSEQLKEPTHLLIEVQYIEQAPLLLESTQQPLIGGIKTDPDSKQRTNPLFERLETGPTRLQRQLPVAHILRPTWPSPPRRHVVLVLGDEPASQILHKSKFQEIQLTIHYRFL